MIKLQKGLFEGNFPITQRFGEHPDWYAPFGMKGHNGIDYGLPTGTNLISCISGKVTEVAWDREGYGKYIKIENDSCGVLYAHMNVLSPLPVGSSVSAGEIIGPSGNTGNSTGPHLHFGVFPKPRDRSNGYAGYIDPLDRNQVLWVDNLYEEDDLRDENIKLNQLVSDLRYKLEQEQDSHATEVANKDKIIEQYQKQVAELTVQLVSARNMMSDTQKDIEAVRNEIKALQDVYGLYKEEKDREKLVLREKLQKSEEKVKTLQSTLDNQLYSTSWFRFIWIKIRGV